MSSVNKAIIIGRLGRDPECRYTKSGDAVCNFSMATSENWKGKDGEKQEKTTWHNIVMFGKLAEIATEYLKKGSQCYIEGRLQTSDWDDKDGNKRQTTEIVASNMTMLGQAGGGTQGSIENNQSNNCQCPKCNQTPCTCQGADKFEDDDIKF